MEVDIYELVEERGKEIAKIIIDKYGENELEDNDEVIDEIHERCLHEANGFFLDVNYANKNFNEEIIGPIESHARMKLRNPKDIKKMNRKELLALMIETYIKDFIWKWKEILIEY